MAVARSDIQSKVLSGGVKKYVWTRQKMEAADSTDAELLCFYYA